MFFHSDSCRPHKIGMGCSECESRMSLLFPRNRAECVRAFHTRQGRRLFGTALVLKSGRQNADGMEKNQGGRGNPASHLQNMNGALLLCRGCCSRLVLFHAHELLGNFLFLVEVRQNREHEPLGLWSAGAVPSPRRTIISFPQGLFVVASSRRITDLVDSASSSLVILSISNECL